RSAMENKGIQSNKKMMAEALFKIKPSPKYKGIGVFALRDIPKGTIICDVEKITEEFFIPWKDCEKIDPITQGVMHDFCAQDKDGYYCPLDLNYLSIPMHMNHCCNGNVGCDEESDFVAIKNIRKGQELCFDYALVMSNPDYVLKCKCGDRHCRKVITGNDWKDPSFQKKNYRYMSALQRDLVHDMSSEQLFHQ
ncbi:MAG: hypothetical protein PHT88_01660, partial [Candidatus Moranbacteria bacterium]|nr:hypothetical protein [Candidatus Moranbacteria bacterium]